ncbi:major facilitator superfamily domain-containing protein [Xylariaceae sp. FL0662B]|nr:major facilitator superfamily domain-containing protein [Xylariaceae sp. FL0662B]
MKYLPSPPKDDRTSQSANYEVQRSYARNYRFWSIIIALCTMMLLGSLENTVIVTSLPVIVDELNLGRNYIWVTNIFFLTCAAVQPLFGQLSNLFGRRSLALTIVAIYTLGSGISGGAGSPAMLIAGRAIQGAGSGGMTMITSVIVSDLVPLRDRGYFQAILAMTYGIGMAIGPVIGGVIVQNTTWRWVFYINLPIGGLSLVLLWMFLHVNWDRDTLVWEKLKRIDIIGNVLLIASTVSVLIALTWAGAIHPWSSPLVIIPLVLGIIGLAAFGWFEGSKLAPEPVMPLRLFSNRTSAAIYANTFLISMLNYWVFFFLPIYFQSVKLLTPTQSGVQILPITLIAIPGAAIGAIVLSRWGKFKLLHIAGFALLAAGIASLSVLDKDSSTAKWVCLQVLPSTGAGMVLDTLLPAFQAGVAESDAAAVTASWTFVRSFGNIWGVAIPAAVFNTYSSRFAEDVPNLSAKNHLQNGNSYASATKAFVKGFSEPTRSQLIDVFTRALHQVFLVSIAFSGLAFLFSFVEREVKLRTELVTEFGLEETPKPKQDESS